MSTARPKSFLDKSAFSLARRAAFYADMASFMDAGIPPFQSIARMETIAFRRKRTARLGKIYRSIQGRMKAGASLSQSLAPWVPGNEAVMLAGAEIAGPDVLKQSFSEMSTLLDRQQKARKNLKKAIRSNGLSLAAIVGVMGYIMQMIVPQLQSSTTPSMAAQMWFAPLYFAFGRGFISYGVYVGLAFVGLYFFISWSLPNWTTSYDWWSRKWFDAHLMPWTLFARMQATFFLATTSAMMRSGIPMQKIVSDMVPFASPWMRLHLQRLLRELGLGRAEVEALGCGILPVDTSDRLSIYSLMSDFTGLMTRLSNDNFVIFEESIEKLSAVLTFVSRLLLVLFVVSTLLAVFDYSKALQESFSALRNSAG